jgi:hypothetical protein
VSQTRGWLITIRLDWATVRLSARPEAGRVCKVAKPKCAALPPYISLNHRWASRVRYAGLQKAQPALDAGEVIARTKVLKRQKA